MLYMYDQPLNFYLNIVINISRLNINVPFLRWKWAWQAAASKQFSAGLDILRSIDGVDSVARHAFKPFRVEVCPISEFLGQQAFALDSCWSLV
jgi:hypothetical protein